MQSKKKSLIESITQTIIGLFTSIILQMILYPLMGIPVTFKQNPNILQSDVKLINDVLCN